MRKLDIALGFLLTNLVFFSLDAASQEDYYRWVDENGVTNFGERAPAGTNPTHVTERQRFGYEARPRSDTPQGNRLEKATDSNQSERQVDPDELIAEEKAKYEAELAAERKYNCDLAKQNLARLETFARIRIQGDDGEYRYLTSEEMEEKNAESREAIRLNCR